MTVLFLDIRDFTAFAERASAREVVAEPQRLLRLCRAGARHHGGHAEQVRRRRPARRLRRADRLADHADRAVAAALEITTVVRERYGDALRSASG